MREPAPVVAIVDYGMGNLFSVQQACERVGLRAVITSSTQQCLAAAAVILPGVGAFGDAMHTLGRLDLVSPLRELAASGRPLMGICLGMQLLMTESLEFGRHEGLGLIPGTVVRLDDGDGPFTASGGRRLKVPQVGWNKIRTAPHRAAASGWGGSLLEGIPEGAWMYFVHSFYARPEDSRTVLAMTQYGPVEFCSSIQVGHIFGCQFHPERSGPTGLRIYHNLAALVNRVTQEVIHA